MTVKKWRNHIKKNMAATIKVPTIFTAVDKFTGPVKTMTKGVKKFNHTAVSGLERVNQKLNGFKYHALAGAAVLGTAVKSAIDFEKSMANVGTLVDRNVEDIGKMGDEVLELSTKLPIPIKELTASLYDIRSAGVPAADAMKTLEIAGKLAKAGISTTTESTNILTSAMNAFKSEGLSADKIANTLFKTVKYGKTNLSQLSQQFGSTASIVSSAGVKLVDFSAATAAITTLGTPASQAQNQIRSAITSLQKPTAEMEKIYRQLGITSEKELIKKKGGIVGAMEAISATGKNMGLNLSKAWGSSEAMSAFNSLTGATNDAYKKTLADMVKGNPALEKAFQDQLGTGASQAQKAANNIEVLSITVGTILVPSLIKLIGKLIPVVKGFKDFIKANQWLIELIPWVVGAFVALKTVLFGIRTYQTLATLGQWKLNAAMAANPVGLVVAAILILIGIIAVAISHYEDWGAALLMILGPFGMIINLIIGFKKHWGKIVDAFNDGGIVAGLKMIGKVIFDTMLLPIQQLLELIGKIPGASKFIQPALDFIVSTRNNLGLEDGEEPPITSSPEERTAGVINETISQQRVNFNFRDPGNMVESVEQTGNLDLPIIGPTQGQR